MDAVLKLVNFSELPINQPFANATVHQRSTCDLQVYMCVIYLYVRTYVYQYKYCDAVLILPILIQMHPE